MMRYLCLGYYDPARFDELSPAQREALGARCRPHDEAFHATGRVMTVATLDHGGGVRIRPGDAGPSATDGPFTEARELVGSFFIIEAEDMDEAVAVASLHPAARIGREMGFMLDVRPIERVWVENGRYVGGGA